MSNEVEDEFEVQEVVPAELVCPKDPYYQRRCEPDGRGNGGLESVLVYDGRNGDFGVDVALRRCYRCGTPLVGIGRHGEVEDSADPGLLWIRFPAAEIGEEG